MRTILYLGTDPECFLHASPPCKLIHYPVIAIVPRSIDDPAIQKAYHALGRYTHLIFTSKNAVRVFFDHLRLLNIPKQPEESGIWQGDPQKFACGGCDH